MCLKEVRYRGAMADIHKKLGVLFPKGNFVHLYLIPLTPQPAILKIWNYSYFSNKELKFIKLV